MAIKLFWIYIGGFLACSVVLVAVVKQFAEEFAAGGKKPIIFGAFAAAAISGSAYLSVLIYDSLFTVYWFFAAIFLIFGILHILFFHKKYFSFKNYNKLNVLLGELFFILALICFTIVIFSSLHYLLRDKPFLFFPILPSVLTFFIPLCVVHTFQAAYSIPPPDFTLWQYPINDPIELPDERPGEKLLVIAFEISKKEIDPTTNFRAKGPETMKLGDLYYHFINDYNDVQSETPIMFAGNGNEAYQWWFRIRKKWYQFNRILDPELSVRENKIKENTIIICERIKN